MEVVDECLICKQLIEEFDNFLQLEDGVLCSGCENDVRAECKPERF